MNRYLLLRDNKQTGPYSVTELIQKGIKAYDLVWLDGKSAAWRYPSEIEELKAYAPVVEEQPFDRFYKKSQTETVTHDSEIITKQAQATTFDRNEFENSVMKTSALERAAFERMASEKAALQEAAAKKAAHDRMQADRAAVEKAAIEKATIERMVIEKLAAEKAAFEAAVIARAAAEKEAFERQVLAKAAAEKQQLEKAALETALMEKAQQEGALLEKSLPKKSFPEKSVREDVASPKALEIPMFAPIERSDELNYNMAAARFNPGHPEEKTPGPGTVEKTFEPQPQSKLNGGAEKPRKIYVTLPGSKSPAKIPARNISPVNDEHSAYQPPVEKPVIRVSSDEPQNIPAISEGKDASIPPRYTSTSKYKIVEPSERSFSSRFPGDEPLIDSVIPARDLKRVRRDKKNAAITVIAALCLLLGGIVIGLVISNSRKESAKELDNLVKQIQQRQKLKQVPVSIPAPVVSEPEKESPAPVAGQPANISSQVVTGKPTKQSANGSVDPRPGQLQQKDDQQSISQPVDNGTVKANKPVAVEPSVVKEEKPQPKIISETAKKNLRQLVSVNSNKYKTGVLGGISELVLTVTNKSEYELDQVEVEVEYLGPEKRVVKTQIIVFNNVKPGKEITQEVPRTNRGVTVNTSIKQINAKTLGVAYSGL